MGNKKINQKEFIEKLCTETWQELYRYIYYKVQNREEAQDITQETYARAISFLTNNNVRIQESSAYLKTIAMNIIRDQWRSDQRKGSILYIDEINPEEYACEDFSDMITERAIIMEAMGNLTKEQQTVLILRVIKGYSATETAKYMKKKVGTVRVIQYRAIKALTELLKEQQREVF